MAGGGPGNPNVQHVVIDVNVNGGNTPPTPPPTPTPTPTNPDRVPFPVFRSHDLDHPDWGRQLDPAVHGVPEMPANDAARNQLTQTWTNQLLPEAQGVDNFLNLGGVAPMGPLVDVLQNGYPVNRGTHAQFEAGGVRLYDAPGQGQRQRRNGAYVRTDEQHGRALARNAVERELQVATETWALGELDQGQNPQTPTPAQAEALWVAGEEITEPVILELLDQFEESEVREGRGAEIDQDANEARIRENKAEVARKTLRQLKPYMERIAGISDEQKQEMSRKPESVGMWFKWGEHGSSERSWRFATGAVLIGGAAVALGIDSGADSGMQAPYYTAGALGALYTVKKITEAIGVRVFATRRRALDEAMYEIDQITSGEAINEDPASEAEPLRLATPHRAEEEKEYQHPENARRPNLGFLGWRYALMMRHRRPAERTPGTPDRYDQYEQKYGRVYRRRLLASLGAVAFTALAFITPMHNEAPVTPAPPPGTVNLTPGNDGGGIDVVPRPSDEDPDLEEDSFCEILESTYGAGSPQLTDAGC